MALTLVNAIFIGKGGKGMASNDTNMTFNMSAMFDVSNVLGGVKQIQNALSGLRFDSKLTGELTKEFSNLQGYLKDYQKIMSKDNMSKGDLKTLQQLESSINSTFSKVIDLQNEISGKPIYLKADSTQLDGLIEKTKKAKEALDAAFDKVKIGSGANSLTQIEGAIEKAVGRSKTLKQSFEEAFSTLGTGNLEQFSNKIDNIFQGLSGKVSKGKLIPTVDNLISSLQKIGLINVDVKTSTAEEKLNALKTGIENLKNGIANGLNGEELKTLVDNLEAAAKAEKAFEAEAAKRGQNSYSKQISETERLAAATRDGAKAEREFQQATMSATDQVKQLQQSTQYFFSLRNMINLLKRGVRQAFNTVKELDAAMTETAVVTKFDVGDMWEKLPEYTANANALGATVQDMYKSATLYYQQGLNASQAMGIASETMKMARIGGLEAAEATDMMTAALRGFNMELNETSAQRINDVYSNLAAKTASNTEELGTAMQRTASIAASAGMSFEGTAAFLAQAIETTREPAENLGTAMKTIVARFQELKKNPLEITEVEGEEVSYNKVDTALQSIGVSLKDTNGQFRDLDDVFLDISKRWDSLSQTQQRYIATMAAGSRQQSRFIAMMSNYERTTQLMDYANNSAGASNEQFGKTMESLEAKLNKLKNAYQQFTMGIANNTFIKATVDGLTLLFNTTNKLINLLSGGNSVLKSFLSIFTAFTALKTGGRIINSLIGGLGGMVDPTSTFRAGFRGGIVGRNSAQAINQPIVRELQSIRQLIAQKINQSTSNRIVAQGPREEYNRFSAARSAIIDMNGKGTVGDLTKQLSGLSRANQNLLMRSNAGTFAAATRSILTNYYNDPKLKNNTSIIRGERFLNNQRKSGEITATEYYKALQDPALLKRAMIAAGVNKDNAAYKYIDNLDKTVTQKAAQLQTDAETKFDKVVNDARKNGVKINEEAYKRGKESFKSQQVQNYYRNKALEGEGKAEFQTSKGGRILDSVGRFGSKISQAGMGLQMFGSILTSSANPAISMFGSLLTSVGGLISGLGMGISGLSSAITTVSQSSIMSGAFGAAAGAVTGGLFALGAALAIIVTLIKKQRQAIKEDAEKLTETYRDKSQKNQSNISNLTQWREELPRLAQGVDANGLNVNLEPGDYQRYLEIVDAIAEMNPAIVKGYNAQGHAIIDNNAALEQTLALEQEHGKEITKNFTNTEAWTKLLEARNLEAKTYGNKSELKSKHTMRGQASKIGNKLLWAQEEGLIDLTGIDIDLEGLANGLESETSKFIQQYNTIKQRINTAIENAGDEWEESNSKAIMKAFSKYDDASEELEELTQPLYESMSTYASSRKAYENLDERFKPYYQNILKELAQDADIDSDAKLREAVDNTLEEIESVSPVVTEVLEEIDEARADFAYNLNEEEYDLAIEGPLDQLEELRKSFEDKPNGDVLVQWIDNIMARAKDRVAEGTQTITSALNTLSDEISAAEGAEEAFSEKTKKDFSTAAKGMKSIFDTAMEKDDKGRYTHRGYNGDNTYWTAAEELLGDISGKSKQQVDKMMDNLEPMLRDGPEGFANFALKVRSLKDEIKGITGVDWSDSENFIEKIDDSANPEVWAQLADKMGMSEQVLISLLNKGKQFANIDFEDSGAVKTALLNDPNTIIGKNGTVIMTSEQLRDAMGSAEYYQNGQEKKEKYRSEGIYVAQEVDKFTARSAKSLAKQLDINLKKGDQGSITRELMDKVGSLYSKDDLLKIAEKTEEARLGKELTDEERESFIRDYNDAYKEWEKAQENELLAPVQNIEGCVKSLADKENREKVASGILTEDMLQGKAIEKAIFGKDKEEDDSLVDYFRKGKDAEGDTLNATTYQQSRDKIVSLYNSLVDYQAQLTQGRALAEKLGLDPSLYDEELEVVRNGISEVGSALEKGSTYFEEKLKDGEEEKGSKDSGAEEKSDKTSGTDKEESSREPTWKDSVPGWVATLIENGPSEPTEDPRVGLAEESRKNWADIWENFKNDVDEVLNEQQNSISQDTSTTDTSTSDAADNLNAGSESLIEAANQFITNINTLSTAADSLNTAGQNLTNAAAVIAAGNPSETPTPQPTPQSAPTSTNVTPNQQSSASGIVIVDNSPAKASLEELNTLALDVKDTIESGATFKVDVTGVSKLTKAANAAESLTSKNGQGASIAVSTGAVDKDSVKKSIAQINKSKATILVDANTKAAEQKARSLANKIDSYHATIDIYPNFTGNWEKKVKVTEGHATGVHNHGYASAPSFGSAARGSYGQVGPKGRGGLTLTGELGYEIAWLPSENRSMILGANGPQMVNLPGDAVVWTHEQSKRIMKQKSIPAGSQAGSLAEGMATIGGINAFLSTYQASVGSGTVAAVKHSGKKVEKAAESTAKQIGHVSVWWENIARKTESTQRRMDNSSKMFEKYIKELRSTLKKTGESLKSGGGGGDDYIKTISRYVALNESQLKQADKELKTLDKGTKAQRNAKTSKARAEANKKAFNSGAASGIQISYEIGKGKKKKTTNAIINSAGYISYDKENDTYVINQKKLNKIKNKSRRKATKEALEKEISDRTSKKNKAEDNIQKANEALEKMGEELYNTFFKWEVELTKIWNITQKIEATEARIGRAKGYSELLTSQLSTGMAKAGGDFSKTTLEAFKIGIDNQRKQLEQTVVSIGEKRNKLDRLLSLDDEKTTLASIQEKLINDINADANIQKAVDKRDSKEAALDKAKDKLSKEKSNKKDLEKEKNDLITQKKKAKTSKQKKQIQKKIDSINKKINTSEQKIKDYESKAATAQKDYDSAKSNVDKVKKNNKAANLNETQKLGYETQAENLEKQINAQAKAWDYLSVQQRGDGTIDLSFDTDKFEKDKQNGDISEELGKNIQEYTKELIEASKDLDTDYESVTTQLNDMYGSLQTLQEQWVGYANDLWQVSEEQTKKEIENAKKLNDSLTKTMKSLLDDVKKKLDQRRQQEDNAKTERDISQKQQRLAALRADTSGGHQVEIAQLQSEIADAQQSYQRSLEDQLLDRLQQQADLAAEQRERQIALQETIAQEVNNAAEVNKWMDDPAAYRNEIFEAYKAANDFDEKPKALQDELLRNFEVMLDGLLNNQSEQEYVKANIDLLEGRKAELEEFKAKLEKLNISFTDEEAKIFESIPASLDDINESINSLSINAPTTEISGGSKVKEGGTNTLEEAAQKKIDEAEAQQAYSKLLTSRGSKQSTSKYKGKIGKDAYEAQVKRGKILGKTEYQVAKDLADTDELTWVDVLTAAEKAGRKGKTVKSWNKNAKANSTFRKAFEKVYGKWSEFATGGLADYTGPAWLDGTPSRPELVLNAQDTKNFIALKDVLARALNSTNSINNSYMGDATYEININVDHLNSDYDVDKVAERVKKKIVQDSSYRNVTQVRKFR